MDATEAWRCARGAGEPDDSEETWDALLALGATYGARELCRCEAGRGRYDLLVERGIPLRGPGDEGCGCSALV